MRVDPADYDIVETIHVGSSSLVFRAVRHGDGRPVVLKIAKRQLTTPATVQRYQREYELLQRVRGPGIVEALALESERGAPMLVLEDFGARSLATHCLQQRCSLRAILDIAIRLLGILAEVHDRGVIHGDLNPSNILIAPQADELKLADFGWSLLLDDITVGVHAGGTLAYMSPEHTGRIDRRIDHRTDLYSLGVTLYQLLCNELPFAHDDALTLVHSHVAREAEPLHQRAEGIPPVLSDIVGRLMAKAPEDRYPSARSCRADLEECLRRLDHSGTIDRFALGREEHGERFQLPTQLYGRTKERQAMHAVLDRVLAGSRQMLLLAGAPGVGKTALVAELGTTVSAGPGYVLHGKFDQYRRSTPYSALAQALGGLLHTLAAQSEDQLAQWRRRLCEALGDNAAVLVEMVPELTFVVGPRPSVTGLGPAEAENRFHYAFRRFVEVLCRDQPLVVFLDDLQWADHASLRLVELMLTDPVGGRLLVVGAYRDDQIDPTHTLSDMLAQLAGDEPSVTLLHLGPLALEDVGLLVADALRRTPAECASLSEELMAKTAGNPFFVRHCLLALHQEGLLRLDPDSGGWAWDHGALDMLGLTDTVVDLVLSRMRRLPGHTQCILPMAACMGVTFDLATLGILIEEDPGEVQRWLDPALEFGLLQPGPTAAGPAAASSTEPTRPREPPRPALTYAFTHDRVQQAAYALISPPQRAALHLQMARLLTRSLSPEACEQRAFELAEHYIAAASLVDDIDDRLTATRLCLTAGRRAKDSIAYEDAERFLRQGRSFMPDDGWREHYALMRDLAMTTMQAEYLSGNVVSAQPLVDEILRNTQDIFDKLELRGFQIEFHVSQQQVREAIEIGLEAVSMLGVELPREPDARAARVEQLRAQLRIERLDIARLERLPDLDDPLQAGIARLLSALFTPAYYTDPVLSELILLTQLELGLREGHCPSSPPMYVLVATMLGKDGRAESLDAAHRLGAFALRLLQRFPDPSTMLRTEFLYHSFILPWNRPRLESLESLRSLSHRGLATGNVEYACAAAMACASVQFQAGASLEVVRREELDALALVERHATSMARDLLASEERMVCALLDDPVDHHGATSTLPMSVVRESLAQATLHYIMGDLERAFEAIQRCEPHLSANVGLPISIELHFWRSLIVLGVVVDRPQCSAAVERLADVDRMRGDMHTWAERVPETFANKRALIDAEHARATDLPLGTIMALYDEAIELARDHDDVRSQAIACERASEFHGAHGRRMISDMYRFEAYLAYRRWGARAKVLALESQHPWLSHRLGSPSSYTSSSSGSHEIQSSHSSDPFSHGATRLDFQAVVEASQALSGQLVLDQLLAGLMKLIIENAGAQRGYLLLGGDGSAAAPLTLEAEGNAEAGRYRALPSLPLDHPEVELARTVVSYVSHTRRGLVLGDAKVEEPHAHDPHVRAADLRSVMCTPVEHQGKFIGVVYLENRLTTHAFTRARAQVVQMLATQAAISIENARLLANLEASRQEAERAREEAERASRAKSAFLANANHELRTPMNGIIGAIDLLRSTNVEPEQTDYLDIARASAEQLMRIIRDTLDVSQIEAGRLVLDSTRFSLDRCTANVERILSMQLETRSVRFTLGVEDDVPRELVGDRDRLMQILINLLGNAVKFTSSDGEVSLRVSVASRTEGALLLRFEIRDSGIGIAPGDLKRIFDPFTRVRDPGLGKDGTGLGLTIATNLVELMSGSIGVESEVGKGSLFWFTARFDCTPSEPHAEPHAEPALAQALPSRAEGLHILIAEDNRINQLVAKRLLELEGHRCTVVDNGAKAVQALASAHDIDAVFMDVHMPVMDGRDATREIRRREVGTGRHVLIIAVTASATTDVVQECTDSGMDHFLSKPLVIDSVRELLDAFASGRPPLPAPAGSCEPRPTNDA